VIDFGKMPVEEACMYEAPFQLVEKLVKPLRVASRDRQRRENWWLHGRTGDEIRQAVATHQRFIAMAQTAKYILFRWHQTVVSPEQTLIIFSRSDDYFFGLLHSSIHEVWALAQGTQLREKESGFRYTPTTCFETFPLPKPSPEQEAAIAAAAKELNELRERWLNPPEWTREEVLEFPASADGPWRRYVVSDSVVGGVSNPDRSVFSKSRLQTAPTTGNQIRTARYPRLIPKDADCAKKLKERTLTNLYNQRPAWLDLAHKKLDAAVAAAYGFPANLTDEQILERLLKLNLERAAEEAKAARAQKPKTSRAKREDELI
jgi:type II restriction/modification system DNA methylase subunit YeeA